MPYGSLRVPARLSGGRRIREGGVDVSGTLPRGRSTEPWSWHGPARSVTGRTWGGCLEVIEEILTAGRFPFDPEVWFSPANAR
jgi:hypothetical protein